MINSACARSYSRRQVAAVGPPERCREGCAHKSPEGVLVNSGPTPRLSGTPYLQQHELLPTAQQNKLSDFRIVVVGLTDKTDNNNREMFVAVPY